MSFDTKLIKNSKLIYIKSYHIRDKIPNTWFSESHVQEKYKFLKIQDFAS